MKYHFLVIDVGDELTQWCSEWFAGKWGTGYYCSLNATHSGVQVLMEDPNDVMLLRLSWDAYPYDNHPLTRYHRT